MTPAEFNFKLDCQTILDHGGIPTPKALYLKGHGNGRNLNGDQCRWRVEVMVAHGCRREGVGAHARWRQPY